MPQNLSICTGFRLFPLLETVAKNLNLVMRHPEQQSLSDHFRPSIPRKYRDKLNSMCFRSSEV